MKLKSAITKENFKVPKARNCSCCLLVDQLSLVVNRVDRIFYEAHVSSMPDLVTGNKSYKSPKYCDISISLHGRAKTIVLLSKLVENFFASN